VINCSQSPCWTKEIGEIWYTSKKVLSSHSDLPKVSIARDFQQFYTLTDNISATDWDIKYSKWSTTTLSCWANKFGELWSTNKTVSLSHFNLPQVDSVHSAHANAFDFGLYDFASRGISPPEISPQSDLGRRADSRWTLPQISSWTLSYYNVHIARKVCLFVWSFLCCTVANLDHGTWVIGP